MPIEWFNVSVQRCTAPSSSDQDTKLKTATIRAGCVEPGRTYLINAAFFSNYYFKIAGHKFTVVAAGANNVRQTIAISPGETVDALSRWPPPAVDTTW